jgi:hypothetical protein
MDRTSACEWELESQSRWAPHAAATRNQRSPIQPFANIHCLQLNTVDARTG